MVENFKAEKGKKNLCKNRRTICFEYKKNQGIINVKKN